MADLANGGMIRPPAGLKACSSGLLGHRHQILRANDYVVVAASEMNFRKQESGSILRRYTNASPPVSVLNGGAIAATGCELKVYGSRKFRCGRESSVSVMATLRDVKVPNEIAAPKGSLLVQNYSECHLNWHGKEGSEKQPEVAWFDTFESWHCDAGFGESLPKFMSVDMVGNGGHQKVVASANENRGRLSSAASNWCLRREGCMSWILMWRVSTPERILVVKVRK